MKKLAALLSLLVLSLVLVSSAFAVETKIPSDGVMIIVEEGDGADGKTGVVNNKYHMNLIDKKGNITLLENIGKTGKPRCDVYLTPTKEYRMNYRADAIEAGKTPEFKIYNPLNNYNYVTNLDIPEGTKDLKCAPMTKGDYLYIGDRRGCVIYKYDMVKVDKDGKYSLVATFPVKEIEGFQKRVVDDFESKQKDYETKIAKEFGAEKIEFKSYNGAADFGFELFEMHQSNDNIYVLIQPRAEVKFTGGKYDNKSRTVFADSYFIKLREEKNKLVIDDSKGNGIAITGRDVYTSRKFDGKFYFCCTGGSDGVPMPETCVQMIDPVSMKVEKIITRENMQDSEYKDNIKDCSTKNFEKNFMAFTITPDRVVFLTATLRIGETWEDGKEYVRINSSLYKRNLDDILNDYEKNKTDETVKVLDIYEHYFSDCRSMFPLSNFPEVTDDNGYTYRDTSGKKGMVYTQYSPELNKILSIEGNARICLYDMDFHWGDTYKKAVGFRNPDGSNIKLNNVGKSACLDKSCPELGKIVFTPDKFGALRIERIKALPLSAQINPKPVIPDYDDDKDDDDLDIDTDSDTDFDVLDDLEDLKDWIEDMVDNLREKAAAASEKLLIKKDGKYVADEEIAKSVAKSCHVDAETVHPIPVFKSTSAKEGKLFATSYSLKGKYLGKEKASEVIVMKLRNSKEGVLYKYVGKEKASDGTFTILDADGKVCELINPEKNYTVTLFIKKGGKYDLSTVDGKVLDPAVIVKGTKTEAPKPDKPVTPDTKPDTKPETKPAEGGSGGGCNAGFAGLALAVLLPLFSKKRSK